MRPPAFQPERVRSILIKDSNTQRIHLEESLLRRLSGRGVDAVAVVVAHIACTASHQGLLLVRSSKEIYMRSDFTIPS